MIFLRFACVRVTNGVSWRPILFLSWYSPLHWPLFLKSASRAQPWRPPFLAD